MDLEAYEVRKAGEAVRMTRLETRILYFLVSNAGRVLTTERLIELAWNYDGGDAFSLKTHISHIRQKLGIQKGAAWIYLVGAAHWLPARARRAERGGSACTRSVISRFFTPTWARAPACGAGTGPAADHRTSSVEV